VTVTVSAPIRAARVADLASILQLVSESGLPTAGIQDHLVNFFVALTPAESEGRVVGVVGLEHYGDVALLRSIAVEPGTRSRGVGACLMRAALDRSRQLGCETVYALTETAEEYLARFGFLVVPRESLPAALGASEELRGACPTSATCLRLTL